MMLLKCLLVSLVSSSVTLDSGDRLDELLLARYGMDFTVQLLNFNTSIYSPGTLDQVFLL